MKNSFRWDFDEYLSINLLNIVVVIFYFRKALDRMNMIFKMKIFVVIMHKYRGINL
jgi:hypothetical protein